MKNIYKYISILAVAASFCACQKEDTSWYVKSEDRILLVTEADVTFTPAESTGKIVIDTDEKLTASSSETWCQVSVSGNVVNVTVEAYEGLESRNATVSIKSETRFVNVPVHQEGLLLIIDCPDSYFLTSAATHYDVNIKSNMALDIVNTNEWIKIEQNGKTYSIDVAANEGDSFRSGKVSIGPREIVFGQLGAKGIAGKYTAKWQQYIPLPASGLGTELVDTSKVGIEIVEGTAANTYLVKHLAEFEGEGNSWDITLYRNATTNDYYIQSGFSVGKYGTFTLRCMNEYKTSATAANLSYQTSANTSATNGYRMSFALGMDEEGNLALKYVKNSNMNANYVTPGFSIIQYASATSLSATNRKDRLFMFWALQLQNVGPLDPPAPVEPENPETPAA